MQAGDLLTNELGRIFLVISRNKSKKVWHRKIHIYNAALGVFELDYDYARQTLWKINKSKEKTWK